MIFRNGTGTVGFQQQFQVVDPGLQFLALIRFADTHAGLQLLEDDALIGDIIVSVSRCQKDCGDCQPFVWGRNDDFPTPRAQP